MKVYKVNGEVCTFAGRNSWGELVFSSVYNGKEYTTKVKTGVVTPEEAGISPVGEMVPVEDVSSSMASIIPYTYEGKAFVAQHGYPVRPARSGEKVVLGWDIWIAGGEGWIKGDQEEVKTLHTVLHAEGEVVGGVKVGLDRFGNRVEREFGNPNLPAGTPIAGDARVVLANDGHYYRTIQSGGGYIITRVEKEESRA